MVLPLLVLPLMVLPVLRSYFGGPFEHEPPTWFVPYLWSQRRFSIFVTPWGNLDLPPVYIWHIHVFLALVVLWTTARVFFWWRAQHQGTNSKSV